MIKFKEKGDPWAKVILCSFSAAEITRKHHRGCNYGLKKDQLLRVNFRHLNGLLRDSETA